VTARHRSSRPRLPRSPDPRLLGLPRRRGTRLLGPSGRGVLRPLAVAAAVALVAGLGLATGSTEGTSAAFTASVANTADQLQTATYFRCADAWAPVRDGAVFQWPLDEAPIAQLTRDSFTDPAGTTLQTHTGESGGTWIKQAAGDADSVVTGAGRLRKAGSTAFSLHRSDPASSSPNYTVSADVYVRTTVAGDAVGVVGRLNTGSATFKTGTYYTARYEQADARWALWSVVDGTRTLLGTSAATLAEGSTTRLSLDLVGSTIRVLVGGAQVIAVTDTSITETGRAGVAIGTPGGAAYETRDATGLQLDAFAVQPTQRATDVSGHSATGAYIGGHGTGARAPRPSCPRDPGLAYDPDGSTSYVTYPTQQSDPQTFSMETWFRTTKPQGVLVGFGDAATGPSTQADRLLYVSAEGRLIYGQKPRNVQTVRTTTSVVDGAWHHVAVTYTPKGGMVMYLDGRRVAYDATVQSAMNYDGYWRVGSGTIPSGWPVPPESASFTGGLRYAAVYSVVLTADQVRVHWEAGR